MAKSRSFSCYLLKKASNPENSLKKDHSLVKIQKEDTNHLPEGAVMYIAKNQIIQPWWKDYWKISNTLNQQQSAAIVFLPVKERWIALTFGHIHHKLEDTSYEYDFGLITTLNALDKEKIKSTDILTPENAKRQKIQTPVASTLNFFDIVFDESIIKKLTGAVKKEYNEFLTNITGAEGLRISSKYSSDKITSLCEKLITIYQKEDFKDSFPNIRNITPIKDPIIISLLDKKLLIDFNHQDFTKLSLTIPDIYDESKYFQVRYKGKGKCNSNFENVSIIDYKTYLKEKGVENVQINIESFHKHKMQLVDENHLLLREYSIYKCLLYDCELENTLDKQYDGSYHLCDGSWYLIEKDYIKKISKKINGFFTDKNDLSLPPNSHAREDAYNEYVSKEFKHIICLDKTNISLNKQSQVEPCDLITIKEEQIYLIHIKRTTVSSNLSHLFNQGLNSVELLIMEEESQNKLKSVLKERIAKNENDKIDKFTQLINNKRYVVVYGIITNKANSNLENPSLNLPLFSRISLYRTIKSLESKKIQCNICLIDEQHS